MIRKIHTHLKTFLQSQKRERKQKQIISLYDSQRTLLLVSSTFSSGDLFLTWPSSRYMDTTKCACHFVSLTIQHSVFLPATNMGVLHLVKLSVLPPADHLNFSSFVWFFLLCIILPLVSSVVVLKYHFTCLKGVNIHPPYGPGHTCACGSRVPRSLRLGKGAHNFDVREESHSSGTFKLGSRSPETLCSLEGDLGLDSLQDHDVGIHIWDADAHIFPKAPGKTSVVTAWISSSLKPSTLESRVRDCHL